MSNVLLQLMITQFKTFFREPGVLFWVFGFPIITATILGVAFSPRDGEEIRIGIISQQTDVNGPFQQWLKGLKITEKLSDYGREQRVTFGEDKANKARMSFLTVDDHEALRFVKRGVIPLYIKADSQAVTFHFDPQNEVARVNYLLLKNALIESKIQSNKINTIILSSVGSRYIDFLIPGLMALSIMNSCIWGLAWGLIEMRMKKMLRRMIATPMKKSTLMLANFLNRFLFCFFEVLVLVLFAIIFFDLEIQGSVLDIVLLIFCGNVAFTGLAFVLSSRTESAIVGNGLINIVTLPMMVLSGIFFSYHNFPDWSIPIVEKLPLTILADAMRAIIIEGRSSLEMMTPIISLLSIGLITSIIGLKVYKWH